MKKKHSKKSTKKSHSTKKGKETKQEENYEGKTMMASGGGHSGSYSKRMLAMAKKHKA